MKNRPGRIFYVPYRWFYKPSTTFKNVRTIKYNIENFFKRGRYGWTGHDVFGFDSYLAYIIRDGIHWWLNDYGGPVGHPVPPMPWAQAAIYEDNDNKDYEAWCETLRKIEDGFDAAIQLIELEYDIEDKEVYAALEQTFNEGALLFVQNFFHLWD